ncbi:MAG: hypothetical protein ACFFBL_08485, partial [Promethearchaeota archaeon]
SNWYFIRSPNRNSFFIITMASVVAVVAGALAFALPFSGAIFLFSRVWYGLVLGAIGFGALTILLFIHAIRKANRLEEEINGEQ